MSRHLLRKGFSLQPAPGGVGGHLVDSRTGDALAVPPSDFAVMEAAGKGGLDPAALGVAELLARYRPFYVVSVGTPQHSFYELDIEDAPTLPQIPRVAPVTEERHGVAPALTPPPMAPRVEPVTAEHRAIAPTLTPPPMAPVSPAHRSLTPTPSPPPRAPVVAAHEPVTAEHPSVPRALEPLTAAQPFPSGELELKHALAAAAHQGAPEETPSFATPAPAAALPAGPDLSQEDNLRLALESHPTEPISRAEVEALIVTGAKAFEAQVPSLPAPTGPPPPDSSRRPVVLTVVGVSLLALGVAASFLLRPGGDPAQPLPDPVRPPIAAVDASTPGASHPVAVDASIPMPLAERDAGLAVPVVADAGAPRAVPDAGSVAPAAPDAGARSEGDGPWLVAEVQARGRVKMGEVAAGADGTLSWAVEEEQRVKAKQVLGTLAREGGEPQSLTASSVGLALLKQPSGAVVKRGAVVAEIIYFEAWAKGLVKGANPTASWRCEVVSAAAQQRASCKISVVTPKAGGAQVTVAIEPRWFDGATDAVLRFAPP